MISVLLPTRGRPQSLNRSVGSLRELAAPRVVEVMVALDPDDLDSLPAVRSLWLTGPTRAWVAPERYGYPRLHEYYNELARQASGEWLLLWNDDAVMRTRDWDKVIEAQKPAVLHLQANHCAGANLFPAWPKAWSDALGHVSLSPHVDLWLGQVATAAGCHVAVPVEVLHDRKDVTGGHDDATYAEGRGQLPPSWHSPVHDTPENQQARARDTEVLYELTRLENRFIY